VFATEVSGGPQSILQRALVMEFPSDLAVRQTADAFMFVSPQLLSHVPMRIDAVGGIFVGNS
jgi:hypothetical protein